MWAAYTGPGDRADGQAAFGDLGQVTVQTAGRSAGGGSAVEAPQARRRTSGALGNAGHSGACGQQVAWSGRRRHSRAAVVVRRRIRSPKHPAIRRTSPMTVHERRPDATRRTNANRSRGGRKPQMHLSNLRRIPTRSVLPDRSRGSASVSSGVRRPSRGDISRVAPHSIRGVRGPRSGSWSQHGTSPPHRSGSSSACGSRMRSRQQCLVHLRLPRPRRKRLPTSPWNARSGDGAKTLGRRCRFRLRRAQLRRGRRGGRSKDGQGGPRLGWAIVRDCWGRGYATEGAEAAMDFAFDRLGWTDIIHSIAPDNVSSQQVARKLGSQNRGPGRLPPPFTDAPVDIWGQTREEWRARQRG